MAVLDHGQGLSSLDAHDLEFLVLVGGNNPPLGGLFILLLVLGLLLVHLGDWGLLMWANSQSLGLSILNTVEGKAVILGRLVTLLGNKNLVPWTTALLVISYNLGRLLPVVVVGTTAAVIDDLSELLLIKGLTPEMYCWLMATTLD